MTNHRTNIMRGSPGFIPLEAAIALRKDSDCVCCQCTCNRNKLHGVADRDLLPTGFTLVETLVAVGLFSILIAVAVGGFTDALRAQRQISSLIAAESNVSLAVEQMTREIRTGSDFCPTAPDGQPLCTFLATDPYTGATVYGNLAFVNAQGQTVVYDVTGGVLEKSIDGGVTFVPITGTDATVAYFTMTLYGGVAGDHWNPRVTFSIGESPKDSALS